MAYCDTAPGHPLHGPYHDREYGFPVADEAALFERLVLEINQAGLSWGLMLRKRDGFRAAYAGFDVDCVAAFDEADVERLLADPGVIRHRRKIEAVIANARQVRELRASHGSFAAWLAACHPRPKSAWVNLFRRTFRFTGPEVVGEFLMSIGYLPGAHRQDCPVYPAVTACDPPWASAPDGIYDAPA